MHPAVRLAQRATPHLNPLPVSTPSHLLPDNFWMAYQLSCDYHSVEIQPGTRDIIDTYHEHHSRHLSAEDLGCLDTVLVVFSASVPWPLCMRATLSPSISNHTLSYSLLPHTGTHRPA